MSDEFDADADAAWQSPQQQGWEARLAAAVPRTSSAEQQAILYAAAFTAGRSAARRQTRRWQGAAALLATAALAAWIPWPKSNHRPAGERQSPSVAQTQPTARVPEVAPAEAEFVHPESGPGEAPPRKLVLDAWQTPQAATESLARELAQYRSLAPEQRELSVSALGRRLEL
jgi:hypothetical protein